MQKNLLPEDETLIKQQLANAVHSLLDDTVHNPLPVKLVELLERLRVREGLVRAKRTRGSK
jgi:hypothetical protein